MEGDQNGRRKENILYEEHSQLEPIDKEDAVDTLFFYKKPTTWRVGSTFLRKPRF